MAEGRNDDAIVEALESLAQVIVQNPLNNQNAREDDEFCALRKLQRNNLPTFKGRYDTEGVHVWIREIKKNSEWWDNMPHILEDNGIEITYILFRARFLEK